MEKCCCLVFVVVIALLVLGLSIGIPLGIKKAKEAVHGIGDSVSNAACQVTSYPDTCNQTLAGNSSASANSGSVTRVSLESASTGVNDTLDSVLALNGTNANVTAAAEVCVEALGMSLDELNAALVELKWMDAGTRKQAMDNIKTWVSASMELHTTCIDAFLEVSAEEGKLLQAKSDHTNELLSNSLAIINSFASYGDDVLSWKPTAFSLPSGFSLTELSKVPLPKILGLGKRRLLNIPESSSEFLDDEERVPSWVDEHVQRHLLQAPTANAVVAKDGSGNFASIQEAVDASPIDGKNDTARYIIYVKAGVYNEQVTIPKKAKNLMIVGDGIGKTIITGSKSVALTPGMTTFKSASLIVRGGGFIGKYFSVENTAGASGHQAVAVRVSADKVAFESCSFDSWQDTLYAHTFRQFYRDCTIYGTVDFIFGNGAAVFQSCNIVAKKTTLLGQQNTYTAQGRTDPHQNTGLSFQNCTFAGAPGLEGNTTYYKTYMGRPWKAYSVCVILECELGGHIDPTGWLPWNTSDFGLATSYFAEYENFGAGSNLSSRVSWSHRITDTKTANIYQASSFVQANDWLSGYSIPLTLSL